MFNMLDLSIELSSTGKSYTFPFKDASLSSVALNPLYRSDPKVGKLTFLLSIISIIMQTQTKLCDCFSKINMKHVFW